MDAKCITTASGEPVLSRVTICIPSDCRLFPTSIICSQSKGRDIIFHLSEKKKKSVEEVTFAFKMFSSGNSLIQSGSENIYMGRLHPEFNHLILLRNIFDRQDTLSYTFH